MKLSKLTPVLLFFVLGCKSETLQTVLDEASKAVTSDSAASLSKRRIALGLKEALSVSIENGAKELNKTNGFFKNETIKIILPPEVQKIQSTLNKIGLGSVSEKLTLKMNRAAEDAAIKSIPIFKEAILNMTFDDAMSVLLGPNNAATSYLKNKTSNKLFSEFKPQIHDSLEKVGAVSLWGEIFSRYNKLPFVEKVNADLTKYVADEALEGLFYSVALREVKIRERVSYRSSPLLKEVFGYAERLKK